MENKEPNDYQTARPFIRSICAFLIYLRFGGPERKVDAAYSETDAFLKKLEQDIAGNAKCGFECDDEVVGRPLAKGRG